jgi:PTH1 family peptidyl-tRNA hydrolase
MVVDALGGSLSGKREASVCSSNVVTGSLTDGTRVLLAKPQTYVNRSGEALRGILDKTGVQLSSCLVVVDDFNLPLGKLRFRRGGSDGGHNGLKSIIENVGREFSRLRIGVGPLPEGMPPFDFVLGSFAPSESAEIQRTTESASTAIRDFAAGGIEAAMNRHNR